MNTIFTDDFNRSDRPLNGDNGWVNADGYEHIISNTVYNAASNSGVFNRATQPNPAACAWEFDLIWTQTSQQSQVSLYLRKNAGMTDYCYVNVYFDITSSGIYIEEDVGAGQLFSQVSLPAYPSGAYTLRIEAVGTLYTVSIDGVPKATLTGAMAGDALHEGWHIDAYLTPYLKLDAIRLEETPLASLDVGPYPVEVYPETTDLDLLGTGTSWTPGTPGAPTFTVDLGVIEAQTVADATDATLTYKPPAAGGSPTFTDPSTGATKQITTELFDPPTFMDKINLVLLHLPTDVPDPTGYWLSAWNTLQQLIALGQDSGGNSYDLTILNYLVPLVGDLQRNIGDITPWRSASDPPPAKKVRELVQDAINSSVDTDTNVIAMRTASLFTLADVINAIVDPTADLTTIKNQLTAIRTASLLTLQSVVDQLQGLNTITLTAIYNLVSDLQGTGLHTVKQLWDLLNLIPTNPITSLQPLLDQWSAWRTASDYTVSDILNAIAAVRGVDNRNLTTLYNLVNSIPTNPVTSLQPLLDQWAAYRTANNYTVQSILDRIAQVQPNTATTLSTLLTAIQNVGAVKPSAPVWPGLSGVTLGTPVNLSVGVTVNGPLHGVLIHVTAVGDNRQHFTFDTDKSQVRIGAITFQTDNGYDEFSQLLGFEQAIYTPRSMAVAAKALLRCGSDISGTVRPWTIN